MPAPNSPNKKNLHKLSPDISLHSQLLVMHLFSLQKSSSSLDALMGATPRRYLPWHPDEGLLSKMKHCVSSLQAVKSTKPAHASFTATKETLTRLDDTLNSAWMQGMAVSQKQSPMRTLKKLLQKLPNLIARLLISLPPDENLYYLLLKHAEECNETFGQPFLASLFVKDRPQGLNETMQFIVKRYQERGFAHLIPTIQKKMARAIPRIKLQEKKK
jgi:hypothetical protein